MPLLLQQTQDLTLILGTLYIKHPDWYYIGPDPRDKNAELLATMRIPGAITWRNVKKKDVKQYDPTYTDYYVEIGDDRQPIDRKRKKKIVEILEEFIIWCIEQIPIEDPVLIPIFGP